MKTSFKCLWKEPLMQSLRCASWKQRWKYLRHSSVSGWPSFQSPTHSLHYLRQSSSGLSIKEGSCCLGWRRTSLKGVEKLSLQEQYT